MAAPASPRLRDAAVLVPLVGLFLLMPPFITLFSAERTLFGIPLLAVYLFGVWAVLIVGAALLARRLPTPEAGLPPGAAVDPIAPAGQATSAAPAAAARQTAPAGPASSTDAQPAAGRAAAAGPDTPAALAATRPASPADSAR